MDRTGRGHFASKFVLGPPQASQFTKNTHGCEGFCSPDNRLWETLRSLWNHFGVIWGLLWEQKSEKSDRKCLKLFFRNVLPTEGGEHIFAKNGPKTDQKSTQSGSDRLGSDRVGPNPGPIRFLAGPCAKVIRFAEPNARPSNPRITGPRRKSPQIASAQLHFLSICQSI